MVIILGLLSYLWYYVIVYLWCCVSRWGLNKSFTLNYPCVQFWHKFWHMRQGSELTLHCHPIWGMSVRTSLKYPIQVSSDSHQLPDRCSQPSILAQTTGWPINDPEPGQLGYCIIRPYKTIFVANLLIHPTNSKYNLQYGTNGWMGTRGTMQAIEQDNGRLLSPFPSGSALYSL